MTPGWCHPHRARHQCAPAFRHSVMEPCSTRAFALLKQERDLHDDLELGHLIVLNDGLELLGPDGADVADRARGALDRLTNGVLEALRGSARQFNEGHDRHDCLRKMLDALGSVQSRSKATRLCPPVLT